MVEYYAQRMPAPASSIPAKTLRTASILGLVFAAALLLFGLNLIRLGSSDAATARDLQASGSSGTVIDARSSVGRGEDGLPRAMQAELTFVGEDGAEHTMETDDYPRYHPPVNSPYGWVDEFPTEGQIVGQPVRYRLGDSPAVVLVSEMPALASAGWGFPHYLGLALMVLGGGAAIGSAAGLVRSARRIKSTGASG